MPDSHLRVLILGGCGFIGRHLVSELLSSHPHVNVTVVDKVPPAIAWCNERHLEAFSDDRVEFRSANLINPSSCEKVLQEEEYDWVINCASETKTGMDDSIYREGIVKVSSNCATAAAKSGVKVYIEISSGQLASSEKVAHAEDAACKPYTSIGRLKLEAEEEIRKIEGLNWIIVRPALVYGVGDKLGITPRLIVGAIYGFMGETMKLLWDEHLKLNTVHVCDLARAIIWLCKYGRKREIYNVVDDANSTQGAITSIISDIFEVKHDYYGATLSAIIKTDLLGLVDRVNEKHLSPWAKLCHQQSISNTPLTPFLDKDSLTNHHLHLDGTKLRKEGYEFVVKHPSKEKFLEILEDYIDMKLFPSSALPKRV